MIFSRFCYLSSLIFFVIFNINFLRAEISPEDVKTDIETLASDEMQGRQVFTPAIDKAAEYIAHRFNEIGLKYFADLSSFKQTFSIYQISQNSISIEINGEKINDKNVASLTFHENLCWKDVKDLDLKFIAEKDDFRKTIGKINQSDKDTLVFVDPKHEAIFKRYKSFFSRAQNRFEINVGPSLVLILATNPRKKINTIKVNLMTSISKKALTNVVGILKGQSKLNEQVVFSAHYDHLGIKDVSTSHTEKSSDSKPNTVDLIFNGADDDASGTTAVIALAEHYAKQPNRNRDLIFIAFTAEEIGGFGSQYFSNQIDADSIVAMINIEMIGKPSKFGVGEFWITGVERSDLAQIMNTELEKSADKIYSDPYPKQQLFYRSDNATLARLGVPAHSFSTDEIDKDPHYHKTSDEVKTLDINSMVEVIKKLSIASEPLVKTRIKPTRLDTSKVRKKGYYY